MRLKSIEIKGFKSFAEKTVLNFDKDITGVVGPNGCGKSNVVDAIRWVLGEQKSKTLRLEKMDNIIFNGSSDKSAANYAEVSLVLENTKHILPTEFSSITITRAIHRDGDSEYKLNGITCRLKDIRDLFMDTGISTDSYAIIELKMIDEILSDTDNARRRLIEQAAGVSKFKQRKKETLSKLESTENDLTRVEDLLAEIQKNLKSLESQAKKARQYKIIKEEYKALSIGIAKLKIAHIDLAYTDTLTQAKQWQDNLLQVDALKKKLESTIEKEKLLILDKEKSLSEQQKSLNERLENIRNQENKQKIDEQKIAMLNLRREQLGVQQKNQQSQRLQWLESNTILEQKIVEEQGKFEVLHLELEALRSQLESSREENLNIRNDVERKRKLWQDIRQQIFEIEKALSLKQAEIATLERSVQQSLFEEEERNKQIQLIQEEWDKSNDKIIAQKQLVQQLAEKEEKQNQDISTSEKLMDDQKNHLLTLNRQLDAKNNEYKLTKNMIDNLEGYPESIKFLKKQASWLKDVPLLGDIIYTAPQYRIAIESILQPYLTHYIVEEELQAKQAVELLKNAGIGKANFLVLEYFDAVKPQENSAWGDAIPAISIVETDDKYKNIIAHLLQGIFLVEDQKDIFDMHPQLKKHQGKVLIYTSGHLQLSAHQISGGSVGLFEGKRLGRQKNLEKLSEEIKKLDHDVLEVKNNLQKQQQQLNLLKNNSYKRIIERETQALVQLEKDVLVKKSRIDTYAEATAKSKEKQESIGVSITNAKTAIEPLENELQSLKTQQELLHKEYEDAESTLKSISEYFSTLQQKFNSDNLLVIQKENLVKNFQQNLVFNTTQIQQAEQQLKFQEQEMVQAEQEIEKLHKDIDACNQILIELLAQKEKEQSSISSVENEYFLQKERIQSYEHQVRQHQQRAQDIDREISQIKDRQNDLKLQLSILKERLSIEFKVDIQVFAEESAMPDEDITQLEHKLSVVNRKLENFGDVNPMAEEAYNEMKERHDFITTQKNDLLQSKDSLLDTILEIEITAKEMFMHTFKAVRENFIGVFRSMFTPDDSCDLVLEFPDNPLESNIDITAKPKGKRPQSINQLSGGEKTLTSLSLLFALYLYKPAPFCILDEVDAPLDDTNIKKFNDAIRNFSKNSQFIIVTHNKNTMAAVDVIYGVTMVKKGISRVVPVDFSNLN
jgi:chromosome segregation protein